MVKLNLDSKSFEENIDVYFLDELLIKHGFELKKEALIEHYNHLLELLIKNSKKQIHLNYTEYKLDQFEKHEKSKSNIEYTNELEKENISLTNGIGVAA
ncbi:TPA_asm: hypothetical protein GJA98_14900 [Listeria monocytogenes]|nr:hypothetical protein [Listeria monocytogenes]